MWFRINMSKRLHSEMSESIIGVLVYRCVGVLVYRFINVAMYRLIGVCVYRYVGVLVYQCISNVCSMHDRCISGISVYRCRLAYRCNVVSVKSKKLCYKHNKINRKYPQKLFQNGTKFMKKWCLIPSWSSLGTLLAPRYRKSDTRSRI